MRHDFLYFRIHTNLHQHPKERPSHLPVRLATQGRKLVPPSAHPNWLGMPLLYAPGIFVSAPLGMPYLLKGLRITNPRNLRAVQEQYNEHFYVDYNLNIDAFAKTLAKIAHGLAYGILHQSGLLPEDIFAPYLPPFIRGLNDDLGPHLVGQLQYISQPGVDGDLYKYAIERRILGGKHLLMAIIRLFSNWRGPDYTVVIGELLRSDHAFLPSPASNHATTK
jgi:hypothetical protein